VERRNFSEIRFFPGLAQLIAAANAKRQHGRRKLMLFAIRSISYP
jgi:hypothetical protein